VITMPKIRFLKLAFIALITVCLSGCLATAAVVGVASGAYYEKNKS